MLKFKKFVSKLDEVFVYIGCFFIFANVAISFISIMMRVLFRSPIAGLVDIVSILSVLITAFCVAYADLQNAHISVDFIVEYFPQKIQKGVYAVVGAISAIMIGVLAWSFFRYAATTYASGTGTWTFYIPYYPITFVCGIGFTAFLLTATYKYLDRLINWGAEK